MLAVSSPIGDVSFVMTAPAWDGTAAWGIGLMGLVMGSLWVGILSHYHPCRSRTLWLIFPVWCLLTATLARSGVLARMDWMPPPVALLIPCVVLVSIVLGVSTFGKGTAEKASWALLIGLQAFRLPLELIMHHASQVHIMPQALSFDGSNFDIATGVMAAFLGSAMALGAPVPKWMVWLWNLWGMGCLLMITMIAVITSPMVRALGDEPENVNTWVLYFPYVWLPTLLVVVAFSGHVVVTRKLLMSDR